MSSDFKSPVSGGNSRHQEQPNRKKAYANLAVTSHSDDNDQFLPLKWHNGEYSQRNCLCKKFPLDKFTAIIL